MKTRHNGELWIKKLQKKYYYWSYFTINFVIELQLFWWFRFEKKNSNFEQSINVQYFCAFLFQNTPLWPVNHPQWPISSFLAHYCCQIGNYDSTQKLITEIIISGLKFKTKVLTLGLKYFSGKNLVVEKENVDSSLPSVI